MATLTVSIKEELNLNGTEFGGEYVMSETVTQVYKRIINCTATEQSVLLFAAADAAGTLKDATVDYLRITNLDTSADVQLRIVGAATQYYVKLEAGDSWMLGNSLMYADATGTSATESTIAIDTIHADVSSGTADVEIFAAL
jgi:hypothetical protein|tara:strand:- start:62 stop:487 length:426 start_codon:yes stop_codon:yes gene_type:complete